MLHLRVKDLSAIVWGNVFIPLIPSCNRVAFILLSTGIHDKPYVAVDIKREKGAAFPPGPRANKFVKCVVMGDDGTPLYVDQ